MVVVSGVRVIVTRKFQVTIPEKVRRDLGVKIGDEVVFLREGPGVYSMVKASEFVKEFCENSRGVEETVREVRRGIGRRMSSDEHAEAGP